MSIIPTPTQETYWVIPGRFLAGPNPMRMFGTRPSHFIEVLLNAGIDTFIDLTTEKEMAGDSYRAILELMPAHHKVLYHNLPITDHGLPTVEEMQAILSMINDCLVGGRNIYLHCYAGIGRTGTAVGCFLVEQGYAGAKALEQIQILRKGLGYIPMSSPETRQQKEFVVNWKASGIIKVAKEES